MPRTARAGHVWSLKSANVRDGGHSPATRGRRNGILPRKLTGSISIVQKPRGKSSSVGGDLDQDKVSGKYAVALVVLPS